MNTAIEPDVKQQVREFYDRVGWQEVGEGLYQNARYEDLRPVAREYVHRCHLRVARHLKLEGRYFLDAGSGPIQYPEYLEYSRGFAARVCVDVSMVALQEARRRIGERASGGHGLFVVADIAKLPFASGAFDGLVSLHTIHHLPEGEHARAYFELHRVLAREGRGVVVNGWEDPPLMRPFTRFIRWRRRLRAALRGGRGKPADAGQPAAGRQAEPTEGPKGTFVSRRDAAWLKREVGARLPLEVFVWRSVSVRFLRAFIHPRLGGRWFLRLLYRLEERYPAFLGENGQYPLIVLHKG